MQRLVMTAMSEVHNFLIMVLDFYRYSQWDIIILFILVAYLTLKVLKSISSVIHHDACRKTNEEKIQSLNCQYETEIEQVNEFFAVSMNGKESCDDILWDVAQNCISKLAFEDCVIYMRDDHDMLVQKAALGPKSDGRYSIVNPIKILIGQGIVGHVALTGKGEIIHDTLADRRYLIDDQPRLSEIAVPMIDNGHVIGVIDSEHSQKNFYTKRHLQILTTIASQCVSRINKVKLIEQMRQKEMELVCLHQDLTRSQLCALRAQMNPHFIFNTLNSIQYFIALNDKYTAIDYLSKFAKLVRKVLDHSSSERIRLDEEIEMLKTYIALERQRLKKSFDVEFDIDSQIVPEEVEIPPMLIQPYVENAILHGLKSLTGRPGKLLIQIRQEYDGICCTVEDNGIGRQRAAQQRTAYHRSIATELSRYRLNKLSAPELCSDSRLAVIDLYDGARPNGTRVVMTIPALKRTISKPVLTQCV